jgi:tetratricopeptide (TPR) repeat protein
MRLCPYPPPYILRNAGMANYLTGQYEAAISAFGRKLERFNSRDRLDLNWLWLIAAYMELGQEKEARNEVRQLLDQHPDFSIEAYINRTKRSLPFSGYAFLDRQVELLRKAGLK